MLKLSSFELTPQKKTPISNPPRRELRSQCLSPRTRPRPLSTPKPLKAYQ